MNEDEYKLITEAKQRALDVLVNTAEGPFNKLPRTAMWGYPEPYTRDLMINLFGVLVSNNRKLIATYGRVLKMLARHQSSLGHIPSLVHDPENRGASDCTPLFLVGTGLYRKVTGDLDFLASSVNKAMTWMQYQSPCDRRIVAQLPTSDWRDEQWVLGYSLYVNTLVYLYLKLFEQFDEAKQLKNEMELFHIKALNKRDYSSFVTDKRPYYYLWVYKIYKNERCDLLGNSLAILSGLASKTRARSIITWVEQECQLMRERNELGVDLPPNFFPAIQPGDPDWYPRYKEYNSPGRYHNGGIWPFVCGFYVAALVAAGKYRLAQEKLFALAKLVKSAKKEDVEFGFNEWLDPRSGEPMGQDWQGWSAATFLYAAECVEQRKTIFFDTNCE